MPKILMLGLAAAMITSLGCVEMRPRRDVDRAAPAGRGLVGDATVATLRRDQDAERLAHKTIDQRTTGERGAPLKPLEEETARYSVVDPRKVVYTAALTIATGDAGKGVARTKQLAETLGGYMQRMTADAIVVRVPAESFDKAVANLAQMGTVVDQQITAQDVTEEYVDLEIRLKNAQALLGKLRALLAKAVDVKQALAVEREMARVQAEIETLQGKLNRMTSRIAYATLSVRFIASERIPPALRLRLPFWWLSELGLESLMDF